MAKKTKKSQVQQKSPEQSAQRLDSTRRRRLQGLLAEPGATGAQRLESTRSGPSTRKARRAARNAPAPVAEDVLTAEEPRFWEIAFFIFLVAIVLRQIWLAQA